MEPALSALYVAPEDMAALQARLGCLLIDAQLQFALLLDSSGQLVCSSGDTVGLDVSTLGALMAGHFGAAREIARLLGERQFRVSVQQGERSHILSTLIAERWLLVAMFRGTGSLGIVRLMVSRAADDLSEELARVGRSRSDPIPQQFVQLIHQQIDRVFREEPDSGG